MKKGDLTCKLVIHSLKTDYKPDLDNIQIFTLKSTNYIGRIFLECWFTRLENCAQNHAVQCHQNILGSCKLNYCSSVVDGFRIDTGTDEE